MKERIVLLGPPASGKGTQAEVIAARYHLPVTSPGAILREELKAGSKLGIEAEERTKQGLLLEDEIIVGLVKSWLEHHDSRFVFDGFPRSLGQATAIEEVLEKRSTPLQAVLSLEADQRTLEARVAHRVVCSECGRSLSIGLHVASATDPCPYCGGKLIRRSDDTPEALAVRLVEYRQKTEPLIAYYENKGILYRVDSTREPEVVFESIRAILEGE